METNVFSARFWKDSQGGAENVGAVVSPPICDVITPHK